MSKKTKRIVEERIVERSTCFESYWTRTMSEESLNFLVVLLFCFFSKQHWTIVMLRVQTENEWKSIKLGLVQNHFMRPAVFFLGQSQTALTPSINFQDKSWAKWANCTWICTVGMKRLGWYQIIGIWVTLFIVGWIELIFVKPIIIVHKYDFASHRLAL